MTLPEPCPRCGRPVALARECCVYCGAPLDAGPVAAAVAEAPAPGAPPPEREVMILDLRAAAPLDLAEALGLTAYDAAQRVRRGGYQLQRIAAPSSARGEAERLRAAGLRVIVVPEADVRTAAEPLLAQGGLFEDGALALRTDAGERRLLGPDLLLIVRGPIARAVEATPTTRRIRVAGPSDGQRIHLHLRQEQRPVEIDPDDFECGAAPLPGSSLVTLLEWVGALGSEAPVDDGFRHLAPALAPALPASGTAAGAAEALAPPRRREAARPVLFDNVAQFRFYSGWRAAVERRAGPT